MFLHNVSVSDCGTVSVSQYIDIMLTFSLENMMKRSAKMLTIIIHVQKIAS